MAIRLSIPRFRAARSLTAKKYDITSAGEIQTHVLNRDIIYIHIIIQHSFA